MKTGKGEKAFGLKAPKGGGKGFVNTKGMDGTEVGFTSMKDAKAFYGDQPFNFAKATSGPSNMMSFKAQSFKFGGRNIPAVKTGGLGSLGGGFKGTQNLLYTPDNMLSKGGMPRGGGSGTDNIPALLTGGEYVVNKRSVDHYGTKFMEDLNKGRLPGFNRGGLVGEASNGTPTATGTGGAPSNVNNNITINVTVEKDGNVSTDTTNEQAGGNQNTQGALQEEERNKQFSGAIKDAVQFRS